MGNLRHRPRGIGTLVLCLLLALAACGPAPAVPTPAESRNASAASPQEIASNGGVSAPSPLAADAIHITWIWDGFDAEERQKELDVLQALLRGSNWPVRLDVLPAAYRDNPGGYSTDAFVAPTAEAAQTLQLGAGMDAQALYQSGVTADAAQLCARFAPVLSGEAADRMQPCGVPLDINRGGVGTYMQIFLRRDKAPSDWLVKSPALSDILAWVEQNDVRIGRGRPGTTTPQPFHAAMQAWAAQQGYYPLSLTLGVIGGFYASVADAQLQPVPLESIAGFDDLYGRLVALFQAGKFFDVADTSAQTDGYLGDYADGLDKKFLQDNGLTGEDIVAIPMKGTGFTMRSTPEAPYVGQMLALPKGSQHAEQALKLVEWVLTTREGYDLANYGVRGSDYELRGDRLQKIEGGRMEQLLNLFATDDAMERLRVDDPANAADLRSYRDYALLPCARYAGELQRDGDGANEILDAIAAFAQNNMDFIGDRDNLLMGRLPGATRQAARPVSSAASALELLGSYRQQTAELAQAYGEQLRRIKKE